MQLTAVVATDAGMHALWDTAAFGMIGDYDTWARELGDDADIERHIEACHLVPINIRSDGTFCVNVRADSGAMPELGADEKQRVVVSSEVYRLTTLGRIGLSGIEYVGPIDERVAQGRLEPGEYDVIVHLMDYDEIPSRGNEHPDFVITLGPTAVGAARTAVETFVPQ
jgi:hypothetical protein